MYWLSTKKAKIIMLLPTLMVYAVFISIPVFIAFYYSFTDYYCIHLVFKVLLDIALPV